MAEEMVEEDLHEGEELYERLTIVIDKGQEPYRIDKFLMNRIEGATRNKIQQSIMAGKVLVNEKPVKSNFKIKAFDKIVIYQDHLPEETDIVPEYIPLNIVFEDDDILIIDKPAGLVVHPGSGNRAGTLVNGA
ncbi:MAG: S4 domain-containing protein, partial [Ginsengibacter sp.]